MESDDRPSRSGHEAREHRRRRIRRHGRRAYIRSVYFLPSLATLGNAICGFAACYVSAFDDSNVGPDQIARSLALHKFLAAAYLVLLAMVFDALDGRLARFARHTTDFGGQLDSLADVVSFGLAPAFVALQVFKSDGPHMPFEITRIIWAAGALYFSCAAIRLARFNVSNEHGEQHHFSFLGLPSPGAAGAIVGLILMQQDLLHDQQLPALASIMTGILPFALLFGGLLMISNLRYPHLVNRYLRGRRSIGRLVLVLVLGLLIVVAHRYVIGVGTLAYAVSAPLAWGMARWRPRIKPARPMGLPPDAPTP